MTRRIKTNWCRFCGRGRNYGDQITGPILAHYGITAIWAPPRSADLFLAGSILSKIPATSTAFVIGTGLISADIRRPGLKADILSVRGPLTAKALGLPKSTPTGDPGILAGHLIQGPRPPQVDRVGIIPHYVDDTLEASHPGDLISILTPPHLFTAAVSSCAEIVTSSLHALIAADALGIPHTYIPHPGVIGDGFKFADYAASMDSIIAPGVARLTPRKTMQAKIAEVESTIGYLNEI